MPVWNKGKNMFLFSWLSCSWICFFISSCWLTSPKKDVLLQHIFFFLLLFAPWQKGFLNRFIVLFLFFSSISRETECKSAFLSKNLISFFFFLLVTKEQIREKNVSNWRVGKTAGVLIYNQEKRKNTIPFIFSSFSWLFFSFVRPFKKMRKKNFEFKTRTWWQEILSSIIAPFLKGFPYFKSSPW